MIFQNLSFFFSRFLSMYLCSPGVVYVLRLQTNTYLPNVTNARNITTWDVWTPHSHACPKRPSCLDGKKMALTVIVLIWPISSTLVIAGPPGNLTNDTGLLFVHEGAGNIWIYSSSVIRLDAHFVLLFVVCVCVCGHVWIHIKIMCQLQTYLYFWKVQAYRFLVG